jgi:hypothetical protein
MVNLNGWPVAETSCPYPMPPAIPAGRDSVGNTAGHGFSVSWKSATAEPRSISFADAYIPVFGAFTDFLPTNGR